LSSTSTHPLVLHGLFRIHSTTYNQFLQGLGWPSLLQLFFTAKQKALCYPVLAVWSYAAFT